MIVHDHDIHGTPLSGRVVNGEALFTLYDTHGIPMSELNRLFRARGDVLDVVGFVQAAAQAGWTREKAVRVLTEDRARAVWALPT